jgi:hypothetical protein
MTFEVQKGNTTVRSMWTNSVRNAFRKQAGWAKLQEVRATAAKHWTERVWYCHNQRWMRSSKEGAEASRSGSFKNGQEWSKKSFEDLDQQRMGRPATQKYGYRRTAACMLCQKEHEECGGSWKGELPKETISRIQSAGCLGQKEVVTTAHNACI